MENSRANKSVSSQPIPPPDKDAEEDDRVVDIVRLLVADKRVDINAKVRISASIHSLKGIL
jgi:hypothetical protein